MLHLAELKGRNHNITITVNGSYRVDNLKTGGEAIDEINTHLLDNDYEKVVDILCGSDTIVMIFSGKQGRVKQFWITVDPEK